MTSMRQFAENSFLLALRFCKSKPCPHNTSHSMISSYSSSSLVWGPSRIVFIAFSHDSSLPVYIVKQFFPLISHVNHYNNSQNEIVCPSCQLLRVRLIGHKQMRVAVKSVMMKITFFGFIAVNNIHLCIHRCA